MFVTGVQTCALPDLASSAKTRGFHTQLDGGPETPRVHSSANIYCLQTKCQFIALDAVDAIVRKERPALPKSLESSKASAEPRMVKRCYWCQDLQEQLTGAVIVADRC